MNQKINLMAPYLDYLGEVATKGRKVFNRRTGKNIWSLFGGQLEFDLSTGYFPLLQERPVSIRAIADEMCWFLRGETNINTLNSKIWDQWALTADDLKGRDSEFSEGYLGPVYGEMWRRWPGPDGKTVDQIADLLHTLKTNPSSRRMIVSGWNPYILPDESISPQENVLQGKQALPPCHTLFQFSVTPMTPEERYQWLVINLRFYVERDQWEKAFVEFKVPENYLSLKLYARSQDLPVGTVFNVAEYSLLLHMVAAQVNMAPYKYIHTMGDAHIYEDQMEGVKELLSRMRASWSPVLHMSTRPSLFDYRASDFVLTGVEKMGKIDFIVSK